MERRLVLTTLSGTVVEMTTRVAKYDRLEDLEDHVVDYLASVTDLDVFGCTLDFVHPTMQTYLDDPIWEALEKNTQFTIVLRDCLAVLHSKESFDGCPYRDIPQAVKVPMNLAGIIPAGAFVAVPRRRHVSVEAGTCALGTIRLMSPPMFALKLGSMISIMASLTSRYPSSMTVTQSTCT